MLDFVVMRNAFCRGVASDTSYLFFLSRIVPRPRRARESAIRLLIMFIVMTTKIRRGVLPYICLTDTDLK